MWKLDGDQIVLSMSQADWQLLIFLLGAATGRISTDPGILRECLALVNRLNEGNPNFIPYDLN